MQGMAMGCRDRARCQGMEMGCQGMGMKCRSWMGCQGWEWDAADGDGMQKMDEMQEIGGMQGLRMGCQRWG